MSRSRLPPNRHGALWAGALLVSALALGAGCRDEGALLRAYQAESPDELIGGDVAMARVGDFIIENDKIRVAILNKDASPGPGVFGGTLVDADLRRPEAEFRNGNGHDQFAEMFPFANLLAPRPDSMDVEIIADGSDGESAIVRVSGDGAFFLDAMAVFESPALSAFFPNVRAYLRLETDYILEPGARYVRMVTRAIRTDPPDICDGEFACDLSCPGGLHYTDDGCPTCECAPDEPLTMTNMAESRPIFMMFFGDGDAGDEPGVVAGDFVFFGGQNDLFTPGAGFDEDRPVFDNLFEGRDPFTHPLLFDYMAASGGAVSYGFFTANPEGEPDPRVLVPIITSSATAFVTAASNCSVSADDDDTCDPWSSWSWERYFAIGEGDIASIADIIYEVRGTVTGDLIGAVIDPHVEPVKNGKVFLFTDPDPLTGWATIHDVVTANYLAIGSPGLLTQIDADLGLDPTEDGTYHATLPPGTYLAIATNEAMTASSAITRLTITAEETTVFHPIVEAPARVTAHITDEQGRLVPAKLSFRTLLDDGTLADGDALRRPYMGESRLGAGLRHLHLSPDGQGTFEVNPGTYRVVVSRGPEYSIHEVDFEVGPGDEHVVVAQLVREVDTTGWVSGDFHLHAEPSFDSGMKLTRRVVSAAAEGLDLAVSTDHDVVTSYQPTINELDLQDIIATGIGVELSTLELGHFIAFPLAYDDLAIPDHNAPDWTCKDGQGIIDELTDHIRPGAQGVRIMCHPRDGFIGYISQLGVDPFDMSRANYDRLKVDYDPDDPLAILSSDAPLELVAGNVLFRRSTCDFDAMEVFNSKRFDLMRTPTNEEVIIYNRCMGRIEVAQDGELDALDAACPELGWPGPLATCDPAERFFDCKMRYRRVLALEIERRILARTPEEQLAMWTHLPDPDEDADRCDMTANPADVPDEYAQSPCVEHPGVIDDWMRWLQSGLAVTITAASDSHGLLREPGMPRTLVRSDAERVQDIEADAVAHDIVEGRALPTYGPVIDIAVDDAIVGDVATITGDTFELDLRVQTASWFGVDRIEVYVSGRLEQVINLGHGPEVIVDYDGTVTLPVPDGDGFVSVIAMGLADKNLLRPVYLDIPFGELQLPRVTALAFGSIPLFATFFTQPPLVPDFYPTFPLAMTNAIFLDVDGDGQWLRPGPGPAFCPRGCDPDLGAEVDGEPQCPDDQVCLSEGVCGYDITNACTTGPPGGEDATSAMLSE